MKFSKIATVAAFSVGTLVHGESVRIEKMLNDDRIIAAKLTQQKCINMKVSPEIQNDDTAFYYRHGYGGYFADDTPWWYWTEKPTRKPTSPPSVDPRCNSGSACETSGICCQPNPGDLTEFYCSVNGDDYVNGGMCVEGEGAMPLGACGCSEDSDCESGNCNRDSNCGEAVFGEGQTRGTCAFGGTGTVINGWVKGNVLKKSIETTRTFLLNARIVCTN